MRIVFLTLVFLTFAGTAIAQCTNPDGEVGTIIYNQQAFAFQGCTTQGWFAFHDYPDVKDCPDSGLVGHWALDEGTGTSAVDATGLNNDGTLTDMTPATDWISGKFGKALDFQINAGRVVTHSASVIDDLYLSGMTVSAWIRPRSAGEYALGYIAAKGPNYGDGWSFQMGTTRRLQFTGQGSTDVVARSTEVLSYDGIWQHVVATWDGSATAANVHLYVNGMETPYSVQTDGASIAGDASRDMHIGGRSAGIYAFDGGIDDVRVYNRVLSSDEIADLYGSGNGCRPPFVDATSGCPSTGMIANLKLNESSGTTAFDSVGSYDGTLYNMDPNTDWVAGKLGNALDFDGTDDYVLASNVVSDFASSNWSFSVRIKHDAIVTTDLFNEQETVFSSRPTSSSDYPWIYLALRNSQYHFRHMNHSGMSPSTAMAAQTAGEWVHLTGVFEGRDVSIYKNGSHVETITMPEDRLNLSNDDISIGYGYVMGNFDGIIDDFRVYKRALSAQEVASLYHGGTGCP
jgi:hypothetical protein